MAGRKSSYVPKPEMQPGVAPWVDAALRHLTGQMTIKQIGETFGLSRPTVQSKMHRAERGLIQALTPGQPGRPSRSEKEKQLERENEKLKKQNEKLRKQNEKLEKQNDAMKIALKTRPREPSPLGGLDAGKDDDMAWELMLAASQMYNEGMAMQVTALCLGIGLSTLYRWLRRARDGQTLVNRRGPSALKAICDVVVANVIEILDRERWMTGVAALARRTGASRRQCDAIKKDGLRRRERERKRDSVRVRLSWPGIMRSMDQLYVHVDGIRRVLLTAADSCVPFRTSITLVESYDSENVARVIEADMERWGPPLIWRFDRASSHMTRQVLDLLRSWGVLPLFGPAYYPGYYGQMERMNREHRQWLSNGPELTASNIEYEIEKMRTVLNESVIRPILNYRSAADVWGERSPPRTDRELLQREVYDMAADRYCELVGQPDAELISWRKAVETVMNNRGLVSYEKGAWC